MSLLFDERSVTINNGRFIEAVNYHEHKETKKKGLKRLRRTVVPGALHNSGERFDPPKCHPNTRTAVLDRINTWSSVHASHASDYHPIIWLSGPAGAGKSAIAQTLAEHWDKEGKLAASFFFSRTAINRNVKDKVIATIAYELHRLFPQIRAHMEQILEDDPHVLSKRLEYQMDELIIGPCEAAFSSSGPPPPMIIILDGLDECGGEGAQAEILSVFSSLLDLRFPFRFKILIASRPEYDIRRAFNHPQLARLASTIVLDDEFNPHADIDLFLRCKLDEVKTIHRITDPSWPSEQAIQDLVRKSSGQFIYPSTVVKYISGPRSDPRRCLEVVRGIQDVGNDTPYAQLDALYMFILSTIAPASHEAAVDIFSIITTNLRNIWAWSHGPGVTFLMLKQVLFMDTSEVHRHLIDLHSILHVPPENNAEREKGDHIRFFHASFGDFLADPRRAKTFYLGRREATTRVARYLYKHILLGMSSEKVGRLSNDRGWAYWKDLEDTLCQYIRSADVDAKLKTGLEVAMEKDEDAYHRYLEAVGLKQTKPREPLYKFLGNCDLKVEILKYIKRCNEGQGLSTGKRLMANAKLLSFKIQGLSASNSCQSLSCSRHLCYR